MIDLTPLLGIASRRIQCCGGRWWGLRVGSRLRGRIRRTFPTMIVVVPSSYSCSYSSHSHSPYTVTIR